MKSLGDGLMVTFDGPVDALGCAVAMQEAVEHHNREETANGLGLRVGAQVGDPPREGEDVIGTAVVVAKRLCDAAHGGQILATELVVGLVGSRRHCRFWACQLALRWKSARPEGGSAAGGATRRRLASATESPGDS